MVRRFLRSVKINAKLSQGKLNVFIAGINSNYGGKSLLPLTVYVVEREAASS
jgi:hypothetical protein